MLEKTISPLIKNSKELLKKELKREKIKVRRRKSERRFLNELKDMERKYVFVSDTGFAGEYLKSHGISKIFQIIREDIKNVSECKKFLLKVRGKGVVGFGGGRSLDVAKKVAYDTEKKLILIPTAPSHNGLISRTASLYENSKKKSFLCKYPSKVVIPYFLWKSAKRHAKAGILDVLGSITAVEDVYLSHNHTNEKISIRELKLALFGIFSVIKMKKLKDLEVALLAQGLAMKNSSRYCSGSEHEIEKCLAQEFKNYFHGELVGVGTLISAKVYSEKVSENLIFDPESLFDETVKLYKKCSVLSTVKKILYVDFISKSSEILKNVHKIRPERFTLWNIINPRKLNFREILLEIKETI